jgi:Flp pilus assembly protein TadB
VLTRWPVAAVAVGLLVAYWDRIAGGGGGERLAILRLEGLAVWTESLRDTIAGAVGLEQAIPSSVEATPAVLRPPLNLLVDRLRIREPLPDALLAFAEDLDDPSADTVVAALVLNARLRGPGLRDVLTALATSTREELDMRRRVEASRRSVRRSVRLILAIVLSVAGAMALLNDAYVSSYDGLVGQLVLLVVCLLFLAGLLWLRRLAKPSQVERILGVGRTDRVLAQA